MSELQSIVATVNKALPKHGRGIIRPEAMLATQSASCFGKMALVGVALLEMGVKPDDIHLLICHNHGAKFKPARHWLGHVELVITEDTPIVVDGMNDLGIYDTKDRFDWRPDYVGGETVVDRSKISDATSSQVCTQEELLSLKQMVGPPVVHTTAAFFTVHQFLDGLTIYQTMHPALAEGSYVKPIEYAKCYNLLEADCGI